jgi:hypothetical protein
MKKRLSLVTFLSLLSLSLINSSAIAGKNKKSNKKISESQQQLTQGIIINSNKGDIVEIKKEENIFISFDNKTKENKKLLLDFLETNKTTNTELGYVYRISKYEDSENLIKIVKKIAKSLTKIELVFNTKTQDIDEFTISGEYEIFIEGQKTNDIIAIEAQKEEVPFISFSNESDDGKMLLCALFENEISNDKTRYDYVISNNEQNNIIKEKLKNFNELGSKIKLICTDNKEDIGNGIVRAEYNVMIDGEKTEDAIYIEITAFNPFFENNKKYFTFSLKELCSKKVRHKGSQYIIGNESDKKLIKYLDEKKINSKIHIKSYHNKQGLTRFNPGFTTNAAIGELFINGKESMDMNFDVKNTKK